jgi:WD40 repeat protein/class 3 adenylate cyclase/GTPase SAR1 family protein
MQLLREYGCVVDKDVDIGIDIRMPKKKRHRGVGAPDLLETLSRHVKLLRKMEGHTGDIRGLAFDETGHLIASGSVDATVKLWDARSGKLLQTIMGHHRSVTSVAVSGRRLAVASGSDDGTVRLWRDPGGDPGGGPGFTLDLHGPIRSVTFNPKGDVLAFGGHSHSVTLCKVTSGQWLHVLTGHNAGVGSVAFSADGRVLASGSEDFSVKVWDALNGKLLCTLRSHARAVTSVAFDHTGRLLATGSEDRTVKVWDWTNGKLLRTLEGHDLHVDVVCFSAGGQVLASKGRDGSIRLWNCETWQTVAVIWERTSPVRSAALAFHPFLPLLASAGSERHTPFRDLSKVIHLWELDLETLLRVERADTAVHYVNAKVVLVGDTGVGKSGLSLVLNRKAFEATDSTPGRHVWTFDSREVALGGGRKQTRETLLWDLAGQPGYRVIHQLHLNEVAVALVVFDARSETDPLAGVRHWERALRLARQREGSQAVPMKKFLVSARADRGGVSVSKERIQNVIEEFGFDGYFETSAREGWRIAELQKAIEKSIPWDELPVVTSEEIFARIKAFLLEVKKTGRLLAQAAQLYNDFASEHGDLVVKHANLAAQFETCIGRLENRDLIRRLTFGGYILLQPELLDAYASAMVNAAKNEPDGLGSIAEEVALAGKFHVPDEQKVGDRGQEQLLLHATVEELVQHDLALRESADDGRYLVFPSQFNRDYEDAPEPKGTVLAMTFDGPVQSLYSTLAVRLGHSGLFETGRTEMWRNAAIFTARAGGKCGIYVKEYAEARGQVLLFFEPEASVETRFHFEEYIQAHLTRRSIEGSVEVIRFFVCLGCGTPVPDNYVKLRRNRGLMDFECGCGEQVSLVEPKEKLAGQYPSKVEAMDKSADRKRDFDAFLVSASGETRTKSFVDWAGGERVTLTIVFTDVVGSTKMENEMGGERMNEVRRAHFAQGDKLLTRYKGRQIKTIGDSIMAAFHNVEEALDFARELLANPGSQIKVRAGIHVGAMQVEGNDVFGGPVNFAARVVGKIEGAEIWLSDLAKKDIDALKAKRHAALKWKQHDAVEMKGFPGTFTLWSVGD